jgi:ribosome-associated translation inhibitor RaiA
VRIEVQNRSDFGDQTRAYAEYRVFSTLRHFGDRVQHASVTLSPKPNDDGHADVVCSVSITMAHHQRVEASACARHAYGAIDRAADEVYQLMKPVVTRDSG